MGLVLVGHGCCSRNGMVENFQASARARLVNSLFPSDLLLVVDSLRFVGIAVVLVVSHGGISHQSMATAGSSRRDAGLAVVYAFGFFHGFGF